MKQNKLSFESESQLWISLLHITDFTYSRRIAHYLSDSFGFNLVVKETFQGKSAGLIFKITNGYKVSFIKSIYALESNSHWTGLQLGVQVKMESIFIRLSKRNELIVILDLYCTNLG